MGDRTTTRTETRYGCFLPDLTGLARRTSAASLPRDNIGPGEPGVARAFRSRRRGRRLPCHGRLPRAAAACEVSAMRSTRRRKPISTSPPALDRVGASAGATRPGWPSAGRSAEPACCRSGAGRICCARPSSRRPPCWRAPRRRRCWRGAPSVALLGLVGEVAHFAVDVSHRDEPPALPGARFADLRSVGRDHGPRGGRAARLCPRPDPLASAPPLLRRLRQPDREPRGGAYAPLHQSRLRRRASSAHRSRRHHAHRA